MPRFDKTGPGGAGPATGWGVGDCTDEQIENAVPAADPNTDTVMPWRLLRRRPSFLRRRWSRPGGRGRGGRGPGRGRRGNW